MDVWTGPVFGVGVDGAEAAEACRRVFIPDISCDHSSSFFRVFYLPPALKTATGFENQCFVKGMKGTWGESTQGRHGGLRRLVIRFDQYL
jgi:hypothetical protein